MLFPPCWRRSACYFNRRLSVCLSVCLFENSKNQKSCRCTFTEFGKQTDNKPRRSSFDLERLGLSVCGRSTKHVLNHSDLVTLNPYYTTRHARENVFCVFTARCYASAVLAMGLCPCLCLSVTSRCPTKTAKHQDHTNNTTRYPRDSSFLMPKISAKFDQGHPLRGRQMQVGWVKISDFRQITGYISKTVRDRHILPIKVEQEVVCALSNGDIAHDLECQTTPFSAFHTAIHSFVTGEPRDFIFGTLTYHSTSTLPKKNLP